MYWVRTLEGKPWKGAWALPLCWGQEPTSGPHIPPEPLCLKLKSL